jgi:hypothetical protein
VKNKENRNNRGNYILGIDDLPKTANAGFSEEIERSKINIMLELQDLLGHKVDKKTFKKVIKIINTHLNEIYAGPSLSNSRLSADKKKLQSLKNLITLCSSITHTGEVTDCEETIFFSCCQIL